MRRLLVASTTLVVVGVAACAPAATPETAVTVSEPMYQCIDDGRINAGECNNADYQRQRKEQATFTEAKRILIEFEAERNRLAHVGGTFEASPGMKRLAGGKFLDDMSRFLREQKEDQLIVTGDIVVSQFAIERSRTRPGAVFELRACEDATKTVATGPGGKQYPPGRAQILFVYYMQRDSGLYIYDADGEEVTSCG